MAREVEKRSESVGTGTGSPLKVKQFFQPVGPIITSNFSKIDWLYLQYPDMSKAVARIFVRRDSPSPSLPTLSLPFPHFPFPPRHLFFPPPSREPLPHYQLGGLGERCKLPQRSPGRSPGRKRILGIFAAQKRIWWQQFRLLVPVCVHLHKLLWKSLFTT